MGQIFKPYRPTNAGQIFSCEVYSAMSHAYPDDYVFDSAITIPDDGDEIDAASVNVALEALADRTKYLGRKVIVDESSTSIPTVAINTDPVGTTTSATNWLLANVAVLSAVEYGDAIHFSCTFNAQVTSTGDGWIGAFLAYYDANNTLQYAVTDCSWTCVCGSNTEIRQYTITGSSHVAVSPKSGTACAIKLFGRVASGILTLRNPIACTWTIMRTL